VADGEITAYRDYPNVSGAAAAMDIPSRRGRVRQVHRGVGGEPLGRLADLYAEDVVIEMPSPRRASRADEGPRRAPAPVHAAASVRRLVKADNVVVHETSDPAVLVAEFDLHQEMGGEASSRRT